MVFSPILIPRKYKPLIFILIPIVILSIYFSASPRHESVSSTMIPPLLQFQARTHQLHTLNSTASPLIWDRPRNPTIRSVVLVEFSGVRSKAASILDHLFIMYKSIRLYQSSHLNDSSLIKKIEELADDVGLIIFEDFAIYTALPSWQKQKLNRHCKIHHIAVIGFLNDGRAFSTQPGTLTAIDGLPLYLHRLESPPRGFYTAEASPIFRLVRAGRMDPVTLQYASCCLATLIPEPGHEHQFATLAFTMLNRDFSVPRETDIRSLSCVLNSSKSDDGYTMTAVYQALVLEDLGLVDGVRRVLFASQPQGHWAYSMLIFDAITYLMGFHSSPPVAIPLSADFSGLNSYLSRLGVKAPRDLIRWVLVDVDDVFLHGIAEDFTVKDAIAMLDIQTQWRQFIPGFTFDLGFCGKFFESASESDRQGYSKLLELRHHFWWFDHLWNHAQPHRLNETELISLMRPTEQFAKDHDIPVQPYYSVSPHHSGIYPLVPSLYHAFRTVWSINVTSTTMYPQHPNYYLGKGFKYDGIQVLPRQSCGVYSRFVRLADFPGGAEGMRDLVFGGSLFRTFLLNPVLIFMTHMTNYKGDRLAPLVLDAAFRFVRDWTNLQLVTAPPHLLAQFYADRFSQFGANDLPLYTDPCANAHSQALWPNNWPCGDQHLPQFVILGPQKTGTTALLHFLRLHPALAANHYQPKTTFEELQFFSSDTIYARGVHWYMEQFTNSSQFIRFEKSATYFRNPKAPGRMHALLPKVRLIVMLTNPIRRAYSWYQHMLSHKDNAALAVSFDQLVQYGSNLTSSQLRQIMQPSRLNLLNIDPGNVTAMGELQRDVHRLYRSCVSSGHYAEHLSRWLEVYPSSQIMLIDAEQFIKTPAVTLDVLQEFLHLPSRLNYSNYLEYNPQKRFFCVRPNVIFPERSHGPPRLRSCLGPGKGRNYAPLDPNSPSASSLAAYFEPWNRRLVKLLKMHHTWRHWLARAGTETYSSWLTA